jgi:site-specific recombinase XerD
MQYNHQQPHQPEYLVYPKRKSVKETEATLYVRVSLNKEVVEKSLGIKLPVTNWNNVEVSIINDPVLEFTFQQRYKEFQQKVSGAFFILTQTDAALTLKEIIDTAFGMQRPLSHSLFGTFENLLLSMRKLKGIEVTQANIQKHQVCYRHLKFFIQTKFRCSDIPFSRINREFIDGLVLYLKTEGSNGHNSAMKILQIFKKVYKIAVDNRWVTHNAFNGYRISLKEVERGYLIQEEIDKLLVKHFPIPRLELTKNLFIFSCYTGLAYIDVSNLKRKHIELKYAGNNRIIKIKRAKTGVESIIPLFRPAEDIIHKWNPNWEKLSAEENLLPKLSNQKLNSYLKEVADICGITKNLTFHIARHTFATTITLGNNVPVETVSKMLGHSKIAMTQKYAKVTEIKIERDTAELSEKLNTPQKNG